MPTSLELKEQRQKVFADMKDIRSTLGTDGKFVDTTQEARYNAADADFERLTAAIKQAEQAEAREKQMLEEEYQARQRTPQNTTTTTPGAGPSMAYDDVFWRYMVRPQHGQMQQEEMRMLETRGTNTQITTTNALGGFLVPQSFSNQLEDRMKWYGGMLTACQLYPDTIGGTLRWPTGDDTGSTGNIATTQASQRTVSDITFGQVTFGDYTFDSNIVKVSRELIQDERVGLLQTVLMDNLSSRLGRKVNAALTTGTGTNEPYGLETVANTAGKTAASATAFTKGEIVDLIHSIDKAYRSGPKVGFMMNDLVLAAARKLDIGNTDTVQLFYPGLAAGEPDRVYGYPIFINNDLQSALTTGKKLIYFGDFSKYVIRQIKDVSLERNDMLYWDSLTVGFMGWLRLDANLISAHAIKHLKLA